MCSLRDPTCKLFLFFSLLRLRNGMVLLPTTMWLSPFAAVSVVFIVGVGFLSAQTQICGVHASVFCPRKNNVCNPPWKTTKFHHLISISQKSTFVNRLRQKSYVYSYSLDCNLYTNWVCRNGRICRCIVWQLALAWVVAAHISKRKRTVAVFCKSARCARDGVDFSRLSLPRSTRKTAKFLGPYWQRVFDCVQWLKTLLWEVNVW